MTNSSFQPLTASTGNVVEGTVKWFNTTKGFGFVALADGTEAFLHVSAVEQAGLAAPREGATIKCEVGPGKKGPQVTRLVEITGGGAPAPSHMPRGSDRPLDPALMANTTEVEGTVKWFSLERGYGFVTADDGDVDIFVVGDCLRRAALQTLLPEQRVSVTVARTAKGREARAVRVL